MVDNIEALIDAATTAGHAAIRWREAQPADRKDVPTTTNPDGSSVTEADRIAQHEIQRMLVPLDRDAVFLGEEGECSKANLDAFPLDTRVFVVDPIDGTNSFLDRKPNWSVSIAYAKIVADENLGKILQTCMAVVSAPAKGRLYYADKSGATLKTGRKRESLYVLPDTTGLPTMTFYCKKISDTDETEPRRLAMKRASEDTSAYIQDGEKGSPALSLAAASTRPNNIVVTREDDPFQPITGGVLAPWDSLAGRFIYETAGGTYPSNADRHRNMRILGNLIISIMAPSQRLADNAAGALMRAART
jgi:fructose-1,6-bisphosphatase/inositol monophosphatase family enzyme